MNLIFYLVFSLLLQHTKVKHQRVCRYTVHTFYIRQSGYYQIEDPLMQTLLPLKRHVVHQD